MVDLQLEQVAAALPSYEIGEELGRGSTGVVLAARHRRLARDVAVKLLPPDIAENLAVRRRFVAEAKLLASFSHVHIIPVYDYVEQDGLCLLVMERLGGGALDAYARAGLDGPASCAAVLALCSGLHYAHERGVLHRDVKPANVLVAEDDVVKVTDFGIAKVLGGSETLVTRSGFVLGTPAYMAPEQAMGTDPGPATDIYGAGTVLYELLAGRLPFAPEANPLQMLYNHVHAEPQPLREAAPDVPPELAAVVMRALARDPAARYASAHELGAAVAAAAAGAWGSDWLSATPFTVAGIVAAQSAVPDGQARPAAVPETVLEEIELPAREPVPAGELQDSTDGAAGSPPPTSTQPTARPGSRRLAVVFAVLLALAVAGGAVALLAGGDDEGPDSGAEPGPAGPAAPPLAGSEWQPLRPARLPQQQMAAALLGNTAWLLGGIQDRDGEPVATNAVQRFDTAIPNWTLGEPLPVALTHAMAVVYKGELLVLGGWIPDGPDLTATTSNRVYALRDGDWVKLPPMGTPRATGAAAVVGDRVVVVGGLGDDGPVRTSETFDGADWKPAAAIPTPREHLAAAADRRYLYAVGGRDAATGEDLAVLERYDPRADRWDSLPEMRVPRNGLGAAIVEGRLFAVGGETPSGVLDTVESYDIGRDRWRRAAAMPRPRHGMAVIQARGRVYALGGALGQDHTESTNVADVLVLEKR